MGTMLYIPYYGKCKMCIINRMSLCTFSFAEAKVDLPRTG